MASAQPHELTTALLTAAIADLTRANTAARTTVAAVCLWLREIEGVVVSEPALRQHLAGLSFNMRLRVTDGVAPPPAATAVLGTPSVALAGPTVAPAAPRRFTIALHLVLDADGALTVERVNAPSSVVAHANADYRGADATLPIHVFVRAAR